MLKPERISWKDSNLAMIGSDLDHKIKEAAAAGEDAWKGLGEETGLRIWRIEQFQVVEWPAENHGTFFTGDSYIVMNTYKKPDKDALYYDVHIWIGAESSQDEYGTAAYKMVESDDYVGGAAVQHREVQGNEGEVRCASIRHEGLVESHSGRAGRTIVRVSTIFLTTPFAIIIVTLSSFCRTLKNSPTCKVVLLPALPMSKPTKIRPTCTASRERPSA
eukprot:scaffold3576_cov170-Amphora_coffeaeformis.AAC.22